MSGIRLKPAVGIGPLLAFFIDLSLRIISVAGLVIMVWGCRVLGRELFASKLKLCLKDDVLECATSMFGLYVFKRHLKMPSNLLVDIYPEKRGGWSFQIRLKGQNTFSALLISPQIVSTHANAMRDAGEIVSAIQSEIEVGVKERIQEHH